MKFIFRIVLLFIFLLPTVLFSQQFSFIQYTITDGLAQSQVNAISQSSDGYLWFGTYDGLSRFDGKKFVNFFQNDGLSNSLIFSIIHLDSTLIIGHSNGLVSLWDERKHAFYTIYKGKRNHSFTQVILARGLHNDVWFSPNHKMLIQYGEKILNRIDLRSIFSEFNQSDIRITSLTVDADRIYVGTNYGLFIVVPKQLKNSMKITRLNQKKLAIQHLYLDRNHQIWILASHSIYLLKNGDAVIHPVSLSIRQPGIQPLLLFEDSKGFFWLSTLNRGVFLLRQIASSPHFQVLARFSEDNGYTDARTTAIYEDREGNMWLGTSGKGVYKFPGTAFSLYNRRDGLFGDVVFATAEDYMHRLWVADDNGLTVFRKSDGMLQKIVFRISDIDGQFGNHITRIVRDPYNRMWCATNGNGVFIYNPDNFSRVHLDERQLGANSVYDLLCDSSHVLLGTNGNGIIKVDIHTFQTEPLPEFSNLFIFKMFRDHSGQLWVGTFSHGIRSFGHRASETFKKVFKDSLNSVTSIDQDKNGYLWFGTLGEGIYVYSPRRIFHLTRTSGLSGNSVFFIKCDQDKVLAGTSGGLDIIDIESMEIEHQDKSEGYLGTECNLHGIYKDSDGIYWISTVNGLVRFLPQLKKKQKFTDLLPVIIEEIYEFPDEIPLSPGEELAHDKANIIIKFQALYFRSPEKIKYTFRLKGLDANWSPLVQENSVTYSKLPPGEYEFQIKATPDNGKHFTPVTSFSFRVRAPFWARSEFIAAVFLLLIFLVYLFNVIRQRHLAQEKKKLEKEIEIKTRSLSEEKSKLAEALQQLKESENKFKTLTRSTSAGIFIYQGTKFIYANPAVEQITGYSVNEFLNLRFWDIVHPDFRNLVRERGLARQRGEKVTDRYEFKIICKDGTEKWIEFSARPITINGKPAAIGTGIDITEKVENFNRIQQSLMSYQYLFENNLDLIYIQDMEGRFIDINSTVVQAYGYTKQEILGKTPEFLADKKRTNMDAFPEILEKAKNGIPQKFEFWGKRKDGTSFPKEVLLYKGKYFGEDVLIAVARDISDRKQYELSLAEEKEKFATTLATISEGVITLDKNFRISYLNPAAEQMIGKSLSEVENQHINTVFRIYKTQGSKPGNPIPIETILLLGNVNLQHMDFELRNLSSQEFLVQLDIQTISQGGEKVGYVLVIRDVTEKRAYENELARAEKLEALSKLASGLAHDINNILTILYGNLDLLFYLNDPAKMKQVVKKAMASFDRLKGLIVQLQSFAKGGAPVKKSIVVKSFLENLVTFILSGSKIKVEMDIPDSLFPIEVDPDQIYRVFHNLLINAREAMKDEGTIQIRAENYVITETPASGLPKGRYVRFHFIDNGPGIPREFHDKIFDPFFSTKEKGRGLGLSVAYTIVKKHKGLLKIDSSDETGTHFIILLPAASTPPEEIVRENDQNNSISTENSSNLAENKNMSRILIMDDEKELREFLKETLELKGFQVDVSCNGTEAIKKFKKAMNNHTPYDLLILDLTVPGGMGGKETLTKIRKLDPNIKAIVSSGYTDDDTMANYEKYGFNAYLKKPYRIENLISVLEKTLKKPIKER
jgi:PAS domain S-box-containing protein